MYNGADPVFFIIQSSLTARPAPAAIGKVIFLRKYRIHLIPFEAPCGIFSVRLFIRGFSKGQSTKERVDGTLQPG